MDNEWKMALYKCIFIYLFICLFKTVLNFGDKPAPAIVKIALRKTADETREDFPEAAQVLKDNTYMVIFAIQSAPRKKHQN